METFKAAVGVCTREHLKMRTHGKLWALKNCPNPNIEPLTVEGDSLISRSRNRVATQFLENKDRYGDYLFFMDDDIVIDPFDASRLIWECHKNGYDILGGAYPTKSETNSTMAIMTNEKKGSLVFGKGGGIVQVECVSTGCMVIKRKVLELMSKTDAGSKCVQGYYTFFQHRPRFINGIKDDNSEDWWFCREAKNLGFKVWLDTRPKIGHVGLFEYTWDYIALNGQFKKHDNIVFNYDLEAKTLPPGVTGEAPKGAQ